MCMKWVEKILWNSKEYWKADISNEKYESVANSITALSIRRGPYAKIFGNQLEIILHRESEFYIKRELLKKLYEKNVWILSHMRAISFKVIFLLKSRGGMFRLLISCVLMNSYESSQVIGPAAFMSEKNIIKQTQMKNYIIRKKLAWIILNDRWQLFNFFHQNNGKMCE